jgi:hypothetical protein
MGFLYDPSPQVRGGLLERFSELFVKNPPNSSDFRVQGEDGGSTWKASGFSRFELCFYLYSMMRTSLARRRVDGLGAVGRVVDCLVRRGKRGEPSGLTIA